MSKARARARADRAAAAAAVATEAAARRDRQRVDRERRERRGLSWRRLRLWQHGHGFRRNKERWAALGTLVLVLLVVAYLLTGSVGAVLLVVLVLLIAGPMLAKLFLDRSRS